MLTEFAPVQYNYQNIEEFETHGMNLQFNYDIGKQLSFQSGLAYTRLFNYWSTDFDADRFTGLYEMQNRLSFAIPRTATQRVLTHRYIGRQIQFYEDMEGVLQEGFIGDYHLLNGTLSRSFLDKKIFLAFGVKNILDIQTVPFVGQSGTAHNGVGNSQLLNWGRTYFIRVRFTI